jgi:hypothetical protein
MKLLFNITNPEISSDEIKELLGFIDADFSFKNLLPDIVTSTDDLCKIIGKEVYTLILNSYEEKVENGVFENDFTNADAFLVYATRLPIIVNAYRKFAPSNDLAHTGDGRMARIGENNKQAWQWSLDADTKAQEKKYYRNIDFLINLLDNSKPEDYENLSEEDQEKTIYYNWINSQSHKDCKSLFINTVDDFNKFYIIESSLLLLMIAPGMHECEAREILPRIGETLFTKLKSTNSLTDQTEIKLLQLIKETCAFYALAWAIPRMSITIFPEGILQFSVSDGTNSTAKKSPILNEHEYARQAFSATVATNLLEIERLLTPIPEVQPSVTSSIPVRCATDGFFSAT